MVPFGYIPKVYAAPMDLSTYFRINAANTDNLSEHPLLPMRVCHMELSEGCTAPMRDETNRSRRGGRSFAHTVPLR